MARRGYTPRPSGSEEPKRSRLVGRSARGLRGLLLPSGRVDATVDGGVATVTFSAVGPGVAVAVPGGVATVTFSARGARPVVAERPNVEGHQAGSVGSGQGPQTTPTVTTGALTDVSFAATTRTIARSSGSFVTDGFQAGDRLTVSGSASNDIGTLTIVSVAALSIVVEEPLVDETAGATVTIETGAIDLGSFDWYSTTIAPAYSIAPDWAFVVCDNNGVAIADVSAVAWRKTLTYRLDRSWFASFRIPGDEPLRKILHTDGFPYVKAGRRVLKSYRLESGRWVLRFAGRILQVEDEGDENETWTSVTAYDPWTMLYRRVIRNAAGSRNTDVVFAAQAGNVLAKALVDRTITYAGACGITTSAAGCVFETTTAQELQLSEGSSVAAALEELCDTGLMDIYLRPVDRQDGILAEMNVYERFGGDRLEASFSYPGTIAKWKRLEDATELANDLDVMYGPRPAKRRSWTKSTHSDATSITAFGRWEDVMVYEDATQGQASSLGTLALALRKNPRETLAFTPFPERAPLPFLEFDLGDTVPVFADDSTGEEIDGVQRVYGFTIQVDDDGFEVVSEITASANVA